MTDTPIDSLLSLSPAELDARAREVDAAREIRRAEARAQAEIATIRAAVDRAATRKPTDEWRAPEHALEAYGEGEATTVGTRTFVSNYPLNSYAPLDPAMGRIAWTETTPTAEETL